MSAASAVSLIASRACFLVPTNRTVPPRWATSAANSLRLLEQLLGLQQVDDVDAVALTEDEAAHLGVPAARLVAEVHSGLQQLLDSDLSHWYCSLCWFGGVTRRRVREPRRAPRQGRDPRGRGRGRLWNSLRKFADTTFSYSGLALPYLRWLARGPNLPSPTSGGSVRNVGGAAWTGRPVDASCSAAARERERSQVRGQRRAHVDRPPGHRVREREPLRRAGTGARARSARAAPYCAVAAHRMADRRQVDADLVGAAGLEHRPAAAPPSAAARSISKWVRACARRVGVDRHQRPVAPVAADRRVDRPRPRRRVARRPAPGTRGAAAARASSAFSARWTASFLATTSSPEVSRSSRCTIPARHGSSPPARDALERLGERPRPVAPRAGCTTTPGGLVDHQQVLVLVGDRERRPARRRSAAGGSRCRTTISSPPATVCRLGRTRPSTRTRRRRSGPGPGRASPSGSARNRSSRSRPPSVAALELEQALAIAPSPRGPSQHEQQRDHPERDRHVGDVERRPQRQLDEVGDRAVARSGRSGCRARRRSAARSAATATAASGASMKYPSSTASATSVNTSTTSRRRRTG